MRVAARPLLLAGLLLAGCESLPSSPGAGVAGDGRLDVLLEQIRGDFQLEALGAMMIHEGEIVEAGVVGIRAEGFPDAATLDDTWMIGALTMSMTATLAGVLVERGVIDWDTALGQVFPDLLGYVQTNYLAVTLEELLSHRGAVAADFVTPIFSSLYDSPDALPVQRRAWIAEILEQEPGVTGEYAFSNGGYVVAGAMMEEAAGESWEALVQSEIFDPLGMSGAGFGPAWSEGDATQPNGHGAVYTGYDPDDPERFPLAAGPAVGVHLTFADYAAYLMAHIAGHQGQDGIVSAATFEKLHTRVIPGGMSYALGWGAVIRGWSPGRVLEHGGATGGFNALVWVAPDIELALFAVTNTLADRTPTAVDNTLQVLLQRFLVP
jgi:CubicO group peptidase (beta-lactamase class C family)